jgi:hypothetical protein
MKTSFALIALVLGVGPATARAQTTPDSAAVARYQALLIGLRDTVDRIAARTTEFRRDLRTIGDMTVLARAARLEEACRDARAALTAARPQLAAARLGSGQAGARDTLVTAIGNLVSSLQRECERGLGTTGPGSRADSLRAWGPHRTATLTQAMTAYHGAAARFARRIRADITRR